MTTTPEERKELRAKWVAALRSGEYQQGSERLHRDGRFCCLGVACDILAKRGHCRWENIGNSLRAWVDKSASIFWMPDRAAELFGLRDTSGAYAGGTLVGLNDCGKTFAEIADIIESEPDGLFID
jgi:hypothetical protein